MSFLKQIQDRKKSNLSSTTLRSALNVTLLAADKGGDGKSTTAEILSITLSDQGLAHTIAECEASKRLGKRLGEIVKHHPIHAETVKALQEDADLLNQYWDRVFEQMRGGAMLADLPANGLALFLRWAANRSVRAALREGEGMTFALMLTADKASFNDCSNSARNIRFLLPAAEIQIVINPLHGAIDTSQPKIAEILAEIGCPEPLRMPVCRTPEWGVLKNIGGFAQTALMTEDGFAKYGIDPLRGGRAIEGFQDWVLEACETVLPLARRMVERAGKM